MLLAGIASAERDQENVLPFDTHDDSFGIGLRGLRVKGDDQEQEERAAHL